MMVFTTRFFVSIVVNMHDSIFILFDDKMFPLRRTNQNKNCHTKHNNLPTIGYSKTGDGYTENKLRFPSPAMCL